MAQSTAEILVDQEDAHLLSKYRWYIVRGYAIRHRGGGGPLKDRHVYLHREIVEPGDGMVVDHINRNKLDNRRSNLRVCTQGENMRNQVTLNKLGFKGVFRNRGRFTAMIAVGGKRVYLGMYKTPEEAARAYDVGARTHHGAFARVNFPEM